ncbi:phosphatidylcholine/phosphatidylserine synthase [Ruegeria sp. ANG-R]|uniref:CDP-alcohol phosphatidyltransferase family protein n=1 Tax=Ruegeria sp. ANG-R TaxID=1577903 RepID=UPI000B1B3E82|nr:phosphatidylcholine/phosphatidylserine synthase [Ruegeria sp. ANG-R]
MKQIELESRRIPLLAFIPNLITLFGLCLGLVALRYALTGRPELAIVLLLFAMLADTADGRAARLLGSESEFGAALDTLSDFFNFGVVPAVLLYQNLFFGSEVERVGWCALAFYCACCAMRLARFTATTGDEGANGSLCFLGVPAPALCCLVLLPMFVRLSGYEQITGYLVISYVAGVGFLAISRLRTPSIKSPILPRTFVPVSMVMAAAFVICLTVFPWPSLIVADLIYIASLPYAHSAFGNGTSPEGGRQK